MKIHPQTSVWITGASSGIGKALTNEISKKSSKIILTARRGEELEKVRQECPDSCDIRVLPADLSQPAERDRLTKDALECFGEIDILINNAGVSQRDLALRTSLGTTRRIMEINYFACVDLSRAVLPSMVRRRKGHHVIVSSMAGIVGTPFRSSYAASKHALHGFYDALRGEHHRDNIRVTLVCPGYINTPISFNALTSNGSLYGRQDYNQLHGMSARKCARRIVEAIEADRNEVYIGGKREILAAYTKRLLPKIMARIVRNIKVECVRWQLPEWSPSRVSAAHRSSLLRPEHRPAEEDRPGSLAWFSAP